MTFSYLASVITQANEAGKAITAVASVTGGIRVSVTAHGYSNGDLIEQTGTTDYNGAWFVSNVATNTYDIVDQTFPDKTPLTFNVTRTGTAARGDKDFSGCTGLTGVTTTTEGTSTVYNVGTNRVVTTGAAAIANSINEQLVVSADSTNDNIKLEVTGKLYVGEVMLDPDVSFPRYNGEYLAIKTLGSVADNPTGNASAGTKATLVAGRLPGIAVTGSGVMVVRRASVSAYTGSAVVDSGQIVMEEAVWYAKDLYCYTATSRFLNSRMFATFPFLAAYAQLEAFAPHPTTVNKFMIPLSGTTPSMTAEVRDVPDLPFTHLIGFGSTSMPVFDVINPAKGSDYLGTNRNTADSSDAATAAGYIANLIKEFDTLLTVGASGLSGVKVRVSGKSGQEYDLTTTTGGVLASVEEIALATIENPDDSQTIAYTYYGKDNDNTDKFDLAAYKYGYNIAAATDVQLKGNGPYTWTQPLTVDSLITQATKATVDAYATIDDAFETYDRAASHLEDNYDGEAATLVSRSGAQIVLAAVNLIINATAGSAFAYSAGTMTIKSSTFTGGATATTGKVTVQNGALLNGGTFDCDVDYDTGASTTLTGVTCTETMDFSVAGTYTLVNCALNEITNSSGGNVTIRAINSSVTTNTGPNITIEYYSAISHTVKVGATPVASAIVGYFDDTNTDRTYSSSFVAGTLTADGSGEVTGYVRYRVDGTTYTGINVHVGKPGYLKYKVPVTPTGAAISNDILVTADASYGATPSTGTTVNFGTSTITQAGDATTSGIYDYYIQQWFTTTNLFRDQILTAQGAAFALASGATFTLSSGALTGSALAIGSGATVNANGGTLGCGANVVGQLNAASPTVLTGSINMQGGTLDLANITTYQMAGSFASGTIDLDSISAPTSTTLDLRNVTSLGAGLTVKNDSNTNLVVRISPVQTSPTLNTTGPGTGTLTLLSGIDVTAPNLINGTRVRLYNVTTATEIDNSLVSGDGGYSYQLDALSEFTSGDVIRISYEYQSGVSAKLSGGNQQAATIVDIEFSDTQSNDAVYNTNAIDGSTVTGLAADFVNIEIDIDDPDNRAEIESVYAWFVYIKSTADGIRNWTGGMTAEDIANYRINTAIADIKLDNTGDSGLILGSVTPGLAVRLYRDDNTSIWAATSNGASADHGRVVLAQNSDISAIKTKTDQLTFNGSNVNANVEEMNAAEVIGTGTTGDAWRGVGVSP